MNFNPQALSLALAATCAGSVLAAVLGLTTAGASPEAPAQAAAAKTAEKQALDANAAELVRAFAKRNITLDLAGGLCAIPANVLIRDDLLEYLLVNGRGAAHESMLVTDVVPSQLNLALLTLGAKPGTNATWAKKDPAPTLEEMKNGESAYEVRPPAGDGFYLYAAWKSGGETYLYRIEDLLLDRSTGQTMKRHKWVYLGSRMVQAGDDKSQESFAADLEGNIVNIALFEQGNTLITGALVECLKQTVWQTNFWLVPPRDSSVLLVFARERLVALPKEWDARIPEVAVEAPAKDGK